MVKRIVFLFLFIISLTSCEFFLRTPFPGELIYWKNAVDVEGMDPFYYTRLYVLDNYIFLYVKEKTENDYLDKLYVFTQDLEYIDFDPFVIQRCMTFAMKDAGNYFFLGAKRYAITDTEMIDFDSPNFDLNYHGDNIPPTGFGFSYNSMNYYIWFDGRTLKCAQYDSGWEYLLGSNEIELENYERLEALYYYEDKDNLDKCEVVLFFGMSGDNFRELVVVIIPAFFFEALSIHIKDPDYFSEFSFVIRDVEPQDCYYTGDGVVVYDRKKRYIRYNKAGYRVREYYSEKEEYSEAYSLDGKTRYLFSEKYRKLMKTSVWW